MIHITYNNHHIISLIPDKHHIEVTFNYYNNGNLIFIIDDFINIK